MVANKRSVTRRYKNQILFFTSLYMSLTGCHAGGVFGAHKSQTDGTSASIGGAAGVFVDPATEALLAQDQPSPLTLRRLSRVEYNNTVRDLLGTKFRPADDFVRDDLTQNFDTVGATLSVSPDLVSSYVTASEKLALEAADPTNSGIADQVRCSNAETGLACLKRVLLPLAERAWRRPLTTDEQAKLLVIAQKGADTSPKGQIATGLQFILLSPHFIYRLELDEKGPQSAPHPLTNYELATRLSYFLWSSMPDAELFQAAKAGTLMDAKTLGQQVDRMLADSKAQSLIDHFAASWLGLDALDTFAPDVALFPEYTPAIGEAMRTETLTYMQKYILGDGALPRMLDSNYTFLNERLAEFYNIPGVTGTAFTQVALPKESTRRGLLTQGAVLAVGSDPDRGNIVRRGKAILNQILCLKVGMPPPTAGQLPSAATNAKLSQRQRLEQHVKDPACASCHTLMDPLGYAMDGFSAVAQVQTVDHGVPIDTSGVYRGQAFANAYELAGYIAQMPSINTCATRMVYTYALGKIPDDTDSSAISHMTTAFTHAGQKVNDLIRLMVLNNAFRQRRGQESI